MPSISRAKPWRFIFIALLLTIMPSPVLAIGDALLSTSNQDHLWFVIESGQRSSSFLLCHHAADMGGAFFRPQKSLTQMPVAITSWDRRVWLVYPPRREGAETRWEVFTLEVQRNVLGVYSSEPIEHLDMVTPLSGSGDLVSLVGTAGGPVALMLPESTQPGAEGRSRILKLQSDQWLEIETPADLRIDENSRMAAIGSGGQELSLFTRSPQKAGQCIEHRRNGSGRWSSAVLPMEIDRLVSLVTVGNQLAAVQLSPDDRNIKIEYVRTDVLANLASLPRPSGNFAVLGMSNGLMVLNQGRDGKLTMQSVHPLTGEASPLLPLEPQRLDLGQLWQFSIALGLLISGLLLVFLIKPAPGTPVIMAAGVAPMPLVLRFTALLIDMVPGAVLAWLVFRCPIQDLITPIATSDFEASLPYLMMAGVTMVHSTLSELIQGRTIGKAIMGGRITGINGSPAHVGQILLRNILKGLVVLIPPLAVVVLLNRHLQGLPDIAARTLVVHNLQQNPEPEVLDD